MVWQRLLWWLSSLIPLSHTPCAQQSRLSIGHLEIGGEEALEYEGGLFDSSSSLVSSSRPRVHLDRRRAEADAHVELEYLHAVLGAQVIWHLAAR